MKYLFLLIAIVFEVVATSALKASEHFTRLWPSLIVIGGYGIAFYFLSLSFRDFPIGIAYAIWSGLGIVLITISGIVIYKEMPDMPAIIGMSLILVGVLVVNLFSKTTSH